MRSLVLVLSGSLLVSLLVPFVGAESRPAWIPSDGPAGPIASLSSISSGAVAAGSAVTTESVTVDSVSCPNCDDATTAADFWVKDGSGARVWVHVPNTWQATYNVKKQNFVPGAGSTVVVQGVAGFANGQHMITLKRFGEVGHAGPTVHAYDIAQGKMASGSYAWLAPVKVLNRGHWPDGDYSWDVRDPEGGGLVHIELSPPYNGQLRVVNMGDTVQPYGQVRFDPDHGWWELHPVRCWSPSECVATTNGFMRNGPPAGTPAEPGSYEQGGDVPLSVPITSGGGGGAPGGGGSPPPGGSGAGTLSAAFSVSANEWWVEASVQANAPVVGVVATLNGGAPIELPATSWGTWAKSVHAPAGTIVQFTARDAGGHTATSGCYHWTDRPPSACSGGATPSPPPSGSPPPSTGTFTASFTPSKNGNDWWVETSVTAGGGTLVGVDARVDGGAWQALAKQSWGSWAKSFHVSPGSRVEFQARESGGAAVVSSAYAWPVR